MAHAQTQIVLEAYCIYSGDTLPGAVYGFASDQDAQEALNRVMKYAGLAPNFVIQAANVPNAVAAIQGQQRFILYNQQFMLQVKSATNSDWSEISILAHEIGHHLQGHTLLPGGSRPTLELEADRYSGFILQQMGASLAQAQAAMNALGSDQPTPTHPAKQARLAAITNGWMAARDLGAAKPTSGPPNTSPVSQTPPPQQTPTPQKPTYIARAVFPGDPNAYYITSTDDIVGVAAGTGAVVIVGKRISPTLPGFAWMYATPQITYGVTQDGRIWSRNQFGQVFQVGYITTP